jgi:hypothetical protein
MPKSVVCEVLTGNGWTAMSIDDYLALREAGDHCPECKGPIRAHRRSVNGMAAHFEHLKSNSACSLADRRSRAYGLSRHRRA